MGTNLGAAFDRRPNALNLIRLALATTVLLVHAQTRADRPIHPWPVEQLLSNVPVDGFFAISGFLIARSLTFDGNLRRYAFARAGRILPGLWVCLIVTAVAAVPLAHFLGGRPAPAPGQQLRYLLLNSTTVIREPGGSGGWTMWNASLWTLSYEMGAYVILAAVAVTGLLRARVAIAAFAGLWVLTVATLASDPATLAPGVARTGIMFAAGVALWTLRHRVPSSRWLASAAVVVIAVGSLSVNYRILAAPALAYLLIYLGVQLGRFPLLVLRHDLSYGTYLYGGCLIQAVLVVMPGAPWLSLVAVTAPLTFALAAASWFWVERPSQRWARRHGSAHPESVPVEIADVVLPRDPVVG